MLKLEECIVISELLEEEFKEAIEERKKSINIVLKELESIIAEKSKKKTDIL